MIPLSMMLYQSVVKVISEQTSSVSPRLPAKCGGKAIQKV